MVQHHFPLEMAAIASGFLFILLVSTNIHVYRGFSHDKMGDFPWHCLMTGFWVDFGGSRLSRLLEHLEPHGSAKSYVLYGQPVYLFGLLPVAQMDRECGEGSRCCVVAASFCTFHRLHRLLPFRLFARSTAQPFRLCVFCPAYLLKHIRDFGWAPSPW